MILISSDIPDQPGDLATWLERQLVGGQLASLIAELTAANGPGTSGPSWSELLGGHAEAVRTEGLSRLPIETLRNLMRRPALLLRVQEWALVEGGTYWQRLVDARPADPAIERGAARLEQYLAGSVRLAPELPTLRPRLAWYQQPWLVALTTAACVLVTVYVIRPITPFGEKSAQVAGIVPGELKPTSPPEGAGTAKPPLELFAVAWGWDRPGALRQDVPSRDYLDGLASAAEEWSKQKPETPAALARRLNEFRAGCSTLILTTHRPLNERDRIWLKDRCHEWAEAIDRSLAKLEEDGAVVPVREEVDLLAAKIIKTLRERAVRA